MNIHDFLKSVMAGAVAATDAPAPYETIVRINEPGWTVEPPKDLGPQRIIYTDRSKADSGDEG